MERQYTVYLADEPAGTASVEASGLYFRIQCRCKLTGQVRYKILLAGDDRQEDLGLCVPIDDGFGLTKHIPYKRMPKGRLTFCAVPRHCELNEIFVPVSAEEPFAYLSRLNKAYLQKREGVVGLVLPEE